MKTRNGKLGSKMVETILQKGDRCLWFRNHGTVGFSRGGQALRRNDGDDKFLVIPLNLAQFHVLMEMIADVAGLTASLVQDQDGLVIYSFG